MNDAPMTTNMRITEIAADLDRFEGREIELRGWLYGKRSSGKLHFLQIRDGTATLQCVMGKQDVDEATFEAAKHLSQESALILRGKVSRDKRSPLGFELHATGM